jgi:hypothetical protein
MPIYITIAFEDAIHEYIIMKIMNRFSGKYTVDSIRNGRGYGQLIKNMTIFNNVANHKPYFVLTDLDKAECAPALRDKWLPHGPSRGMIFRVAVREAESWLLAHREAISEFLGVSATKIPLNVDTIEDPKIFLVNLARKSKRKSIKFGIPPKQGSTALIGPEYNSLITQWIYDHWSPSVARTRSQSLDKAIIALEKFHKP